MPRRCARIEPDLPPDHPLEPGTRPTARTSSPSERIAASESAISEISTGAGKPVSTLELHRCRAPRRLCRRRAAGQREGCTRGGKAAAKAKAGDTSRRTARSSTITTKIRLAAGRRQRGRDRARHLQNGDDAA